MGKRHGSKEAYEASRAGIRESNALWEKEWNAMQKDPDYHDKRRARESAVSGKPAAWALFAAAAINSGKGPSDATKIADQTVAAFESRFIPPNTDDDSDDD